MMKYDKKISADILYYSIWYGLLTGLVEGVLLFVFQRFELLEGQITYLGSGWEVIWIAPLFDALFFLFIGFFLALLAQILPKTFTRRLTLFTFSFLLIFAWIEIYLCGRLLLLANVILAAGASYEISIFLFRRRGQLSRIVYDTTKWLISTVILLVIVIQGSSWLRERLAISKLSPASASAPNILFIVVDTLRADHLSLQGYDRETDPTLKRLASEGVMFENAYSASSWTLTSHASLFTGRYPYEHKADGNRRLDNTYPTIAEAITSYGYRTGAFIGNFETVKKQWGFARGFIHFEDYYQTVANLAVSSVYGRLSEYEILHRIFGMQFKIDRKWAPEINKAALDWIDRDTSKPFFVFINYFDVHDPYISPESGRFSKLKNPGGLVNTDWTNANIYEPKNPEQIQGEIDAYDGGIFYVDHEIGILLNELNQRGVLENTIVVITSDHGEMFGEHGLWEHHNSLYKPVIHVPLIIWNPKLIPQNARIFTPVSNVAISTTLLDLLGQTTTNPTEFPVPSLASLWRNSSATASFPFPIEEMAQASWANPQQLSYYGDMFSVISPDWQYIEHSKFGVELYNTTNDPNELDNQATDKQNAYVLQMLKGDYLDALSKLGLTWPYDTTK